MSEIILCNQPMSTDYLQNNCGIAMDTLEGASCYKPSTLSAYTPYLLNNDSSSTGQSILRQLASKPVAKELTHLSLSFGGDNTLALAEITNKLKEYNVGLIGASTSVYGNRIGGFAGAVKNYQDALMNYRSAIKTNPGSKLLAKQRAHASFQKLQLQFKHELNAVTSGVKIRRGTPLTSVERTTNIAKSSRYVPKLNITNQIQAKNLVKFSKMTKLLGNGLAVIDFGGRAGNIHNSYQADGNWECEMFIESSSFVLSAMEGTAAVNAGSAALGFLIVATPIGWVGLIVGGIAVAGAAAAISMEINQVAKEDAGGIYDSLMKKVDSL